MKVLFISNLFPDAAEPTRGLDNACLVHELAKSCDIRVLALRPTRCLPLLWRHGTFQRRPEDEAVSPVFCRTAYIPKVGGAVNHLLMARSIRRTLLSLRDRFRFDRALCAWVYPDGCAVAALADHLHFPFVVIAQGTDVHRYLNMSARRRIIIRAMNRAIGVVTRSSSLAGLLRARGVEDSRLKTIYNGVAFDLFQPAAQSEARKELGLPPTAPVILYVGNFLPVKNPLLLMAAHAEINRRSAQRPCHLIMLGDGPLRSRILSHAAAAGTLPWITLPGRKPPAQVARYMQAANVLCVPSNNEGAPNVILEAFACGLPVVATNVGGISEVLCHDFLGCLVEKSNLAELVTALTRTLAAPPQTDRISDHARRFSWERTAAEYLQVMSR